MEQELTYEQRLRLWETDNGRDSGWVLELRGEPLALFIDCEYEDMFWDSYRITLLTQDPEVRAQFHTLAFWEKEHCDMVWRNRESGLVVSGGLGGAYPAVGWIEDTERKVMRGLYIPVGPPSLRDRVVLWWRKRNRVPKSG